MVGKTQITFPQVAITEITQPVHLEGLWWIDLQGNSATKRQRVKQMHLQSIYKVGSNPYI